MAVTSYDPTLYQIIRNAARTQDRGLLDGRDLDRIAHLAAERLTQAGWRTPLPGAPALWSQGYHHTSETYGVVAGTETLFPGGGKATKADAALTASARTDIPRMAAALTAVLDKCVAAKDALSDPFVTIRIPLLDANEIIALITDALGGTGE